MRKYEDEMDIVVGALLTAKMMLETLPDDSLDELERAVQAVMKFNAATQRLKDQKELLRWARDTVSICKSMEEE